MAEERQISGHSSQYWERKSRGVTRDQTVLFFSQLFFAALNFPFSKQFLTNQHFSSRDGTVINSREWTEVSRDTFPRLYGGKDAE